MDVTSANLQSLTRKIIGYYNNEKPHSSLKMMTPQYLQHRSVNKPNVNDLN
ncbi:MAG: transposase [Chitinophagaceae bacterium]|nr:transposase [Chitinophagaceae bacterium]